VLFALYVAGIVGAMAAGVVLRRHRRPGLGLRASSWNCPKYQWPPLRDLAIGLWQRAWIFLRRAGHDHLHRHRGAVGAAELPAGRAGPEPVEASIAGHIASGLEVVVEPIGSTTRSRSR
jgi:ferrous iron transport protein B